MSNYFEHDSCTFCTHNKVCRLKEIRERIDAKLHDADLIIDDHLHVIVECDEFSKFVGFTITTPYTSPVPIVDHTPKVTWATTTSGTSASDSTITGTNNV